MSRIYEKYDKIGNFNWYEERLERAKELGYNYVSESIIQTYLKTKSARKTGKILCNLSSGAVYDFLHKIKFPVNRRGYDNPKKLFEYNNRMVTFDTIQFLTGLSKATISRRLSKGMTVEELIRNVKL